MKKKELRARSLAIGLVLITLSTLAACQTATESSSTEQNASVEEEAPYVDDSGDKEFENTIDNADLLANLRSGGYVIFFRHAQTEEDYADQASDNLDLTDCSTQRELSETGWQQAREIGEQFTELGIPVGDVYSSEYCRAWQTADLAFGQYEQKAELNFEPAEEYSDEQFATMRNNLTPFLTAEPEKGTNTILVSHDDVFDAATGIYPKPQGIAFIIKPTGDGFTLIAALESQQWKTLAE